MKGLGNLSAKTNGTSDITQIKERAGNMTRTQTVLARLRELILKGEFEAGRKMHAGELADRLGVSRTPIRNALAVLESEELVDYSSNRGYTAREFGIQDVLDAIEVRASLEATGIRILAERGIDSDTSIYVQQQINAAREVLEKGHWSEGAETIWYSHNFNIHGALVQATKNRYLINAVARTLVGPVFGDSHDSSVLAIKSAEVNGGIPSHIWESQIQHERLFKAIEAGEVGRAQNMMYEHVMLHRDRILSNSDSADSCGQ